MFKNAKIYRLTSVGPFWDLEELNDKLAAHAFVPGGQLELQTLGWVPPRENADLAHAVGGKIILTLRVESKLLPGKAINQATAVRAREIEEQQGYKPGRKQMKAIREQIIDEKLPTALTQYDDIRLWIDPIERWLIIDTSTPTKADTVIGLLAKSIEPFPLENLYVAMSPASAMTGWLKTRPRPTSASTRTQNCARRAKAARPSATSSTPSTPTTCAATSSPASNAPAWQ